MSACVCITAKNWQFNCFYYLLKLHQHSVYNYLWVWLYTEIIFCTKLLETNFTIFKVNKISDSMWNINNNKANAISTKAIEPTSLLPVAQSSKIEKDQLLWKKSVYIFVEIVIVFCNGYYNRSKLQSARW